MQNPFANQAFSMAALTAAINLIPNSYGRLQQLGLFPDVGVNTRQVLVEEQNGVLTLLPSLPPGSPGTPARSGKRKVRSFAVPHIPHDDAILPGDYEGLRAFGSETELESVSTVVARRLADMRAKHDLTREWLRMGALKGLILDADGSTLYNLYTEFGVAQNSVDFVLGTATTDVRAKCAAVLRLVEDNLMGEVMSGVRALVSAEFYDKLTAHARVEAAYANWSAAETRLGGDLRKGFTFGGVTFEEYRGVGVDADANVRRFIAAGEGHAFPEGTLRTFGTSNAPADFVETTNTIGLPYYAKQEPRKFGRGIDIHTQSNPLPLCYRPGVLIKLTTSN